MNTFICYIFFILVWIRNVYPQSSEVWKNPTAEQKAYNQFAIEFTMEMSCMVNSSHNVMLSPFSVWSILALLTEGSQGNTRSQLHTTLHLGKKNLGQRYRELDNILQTGNDSSVEFSNGNAILTDKNRPVLRDYENKVTKTYNARIIPVNFHEVKQSADQINSWVSEITRRRITRIVNEGDLKNPQLLLANAVYFKGTWKHPFNETSTADENFLDGAGNVVAKVPTMKQVAQFENGFIKEVESHILVLPYQGDKFSMLIAKPERNVSVMQMLGKMNLVSMDEVLRQLRQMQYDVLDEVQVHLPHFVIRSDFVLNSALASLGITDAFSDHADLKRISSHDLYVSKIIHKAEIEVNERGTVASASTGVTFAEKMMPTLFKVNRPFAYFIIENESKTIVFSGRVTNPLAG